MTQKTWEPGYWAGFRGSTIEGVQYTTYMEVGVSERRKQAL